MNYIIKNTRELNIKNNSIDYIRLILTINFFAV